MITPGQTGEASFTVTLKDTADAIAIAPQDEFPQVFSTSRLVALMELSAARLMRPLLQPGQLSVGVAINTSHTAATPVGGQVRSVATYLGQEGKLYRFKVEAFDEGGSIGQGEHSRAIVSTERLLAGAAKRKPL